MYKVEIELPNYAAANALAILAEEGQLGDLINGHLDLVDLEEYQLADSYACVAFDDNIEDGGKHSVKFD